MARVPVPAAGGVELRPLSGNRLQPVDATGGLRQVGESLERAGAFGLSYAEEQDRIEAALDNAAVRERDNQDAEWLRERLWTGDDAYFKLRGFDALNAREGLEAELEERRRAALEGLTTPRQRAMYDRVSSNRFGSEVVGVARYATEQAQVEEDRQSVSRITNASNDAMTHWRDPTRREEFIGIAELETMGLADRQGWAPERAAEARTEVRSNILARIVRQQIDDDPIAGARFLNEQRGYILPSEEFALDNELRGPLMERQVSEFADAWEQGRAPRNLLLDTRAPPAPPVVPPTLSLADQARARDAEGGMLPFQLTVVPTEQGAAIVNLVRPDGSPMTPEEAAAEFRRTGGHLGIYEDEAAAAEVVARVTESEEDRFLAAPPPLELLSSDSPTARSANGFQLLSAPGAPRDGGARVHKGYDLAPPEAGSAGWYPTQDFRIERPRSGERQGLTADVVLADGTRVTVMHLAELPRPGQYRAGQLAAVAGNTGNARTTPTHFHVEAKDASGRAIDPRPLFAAGTAGAGGAGAAAGGTPAVRDLGQAYAWVDSLDLPHDMRMALRREVGTRIATQRAVVDQRESAAADQAYEFYARNPESFTSTSVIPRQVWNSMGARDRAQFEGLASQARDRIESKARATTDWEAYGRYSDMAALEPEKFVRLPLAELRQNLSDGDFEQMLNIRRAIQSATAGSSGEQVTHSRINTVTNPLLLASGIARPPEKRGERDADEDKEYWRTVGQFRQAVSQGVARWQRNNPGKEIDDDTIRDIANSQLVRAWKGDREENERWLFQFGAGEGAQFAIPRAEDQRIRAEFRRRYRREPTPAEVGELWRYGPTGGR